MRGAKRLSGAALLTITIFLLTTPAAHAGVSPKQQQLERAAKRAHADAKSAKHTIRFFKRHDRLLKRGPWHVRSRAWNAVNAAKWRAERAGRELARIRVELRRVVIPHYEQWLCIHRYEGSWTDSGSPYWGGLQMDLGFQQAYGLDFYRAKGTADHWTPREQMIVAERAYLTRGFWPWPNTARYCGLL